MSLIARRTWLRLGVLAAVVALASCETPGARRATPMPERPVAPVLAGPPLYTLSESQFGEALAEFRTAAPSLPERVVAIGRKNIGQPYAMYLLGEYPFETYDADPIYCLSKSDCVTFCEHTYAAAMSDNWWSFLQSLQRIRYREGRVGMLTRKHYTLADWNVHNGYLFEDLTRSLAGNAARPLTERINRAAFFKPFGIGQDIPIEEWHDFYIPTDAVPAILPYLQNGDFVNIIRGKGEAVWAGHTGLIAIGADGATNFLHSAGPAVREQPLMEYLREDKPCVGIKILRLWPDAEDRLRLSLYEPNATPITSRALEQALAKSPLMSTGAPSWYSQDWSKAMQLQAFSLDFTTPIDPALQEKLEAADAQIAGELGIAPDQRAIGVLDLRERRFAALDADTLFYGASVPKIAIVAAYLGTLAPGALDLDPTTRLELERVLKRSDNALAAKYSQLVGLDALQKFVQSPKYRFYDKDRGGGLWCGKHYGLDSPRVGDPLGDHSHAVTVRQCLRFYLMMEQGKLVGGAASALLKELFAAPSLDFHNKNFVAGLAGRRAVVLRKSGEWEDWHLDTARVHAGDRLYLLAGATRHPAGQTYLAKMAAAIDDALGGAPAATPFRHATLIHHRPGDFSGTTIGTGLTTGSSATDAPTREDAVAFAVVAPEVVGLPVNDAPTHSTGAIVYTSPVYASRLPFNEAVLSMNVRTPEHTGARLEFRVGRRDDEAVATWSPWMFIMDWGSAPPEGERVMKFDGGRIDVDYFRSDRHYAWFQYRIVARRDAGAGGDVGLAQVSVTVSEMTGMPTPVDVPPTVSVAGLDWQRALDVPVRDQHVADPNLRGQLCSPASTSMVLSYRGVDVDCEAVHPVVYDPHHDIYGNWPRNVQAAYQLGVAGYLTRIGTWAEAERYIARGQPLILSIKAPERGVLRSTPYKATDGHLIVLRGFDETGRPLINDPAVRAGEVGGQYAMDRDELEAAWLRATGGLAYVLTGKAD